MNFNSLQNKVIIITGASSGIGLASAIFALQNKAKVVLAARKTDHVKGILNQNNFEEQSFLIVPTDVSDEESCKKLIEKTIEKFGSINILINNAGISMRATFKDVDVSVLQQLMNVNFWGTVYCTKYALPYLIKSEGNIVGISSVAGFKGLPARTGYSASKFAMNGFLESLKLELVQKNVGVHIVCPGYTNSNIRNSALNQSGNLQGESPLDEKKLMSAEQVAFEIYKAIIIKKDFTVLTLLGKATYWLNKFFPKFIDKKTIQLIQKEVNSPI
jgi:short-subunit dehydrogenase